MPKDSSISLNPAVARRRTIQWLLVPIVVITLALGWKYPVLGFVVPVVMLMGIVGGLFNIELSQNNTRLCQEDAPAVDNTYCDDGIYDMAHLAKSRRLAALGLYFLDDVRYHYLDRHYSRNNDSSENVVCVLPDGNTTECARRS